MSDAPRVVLASASPRRRELLAALVPEFRVAATDIPEPLTGDPLADARALAVAKAQAGAARCPGAVVVAADTVVADAARSYGKPAGAEDARAMWRALRGRAHHVLTGVAVADAAGEVAAAVSVATVRLTALSDAAVERYVASGRPLDKAGGYAIQDEDVPTVSGHDGCYCAVMGLPLWSLRRLLQAAGVDCADPAAAFARCRDCPDRPRA